MTTKARPASKQATVPRGDAPHDVSPLSMRWVEAFRATLRTGSVSAAARLLGVSQPAVTQYLQALEAAGSLRLFDRRRGRLLPTTEAQVLLAEVERVFSGLEQVRRRMQELQAHAHVTLRVGCLHALGIGFMPRVVARFMQRHPDAHVDLQVQSSRSLRDALADGALDLAVVADEADPTGLNASVFYDMPAVCVMPPRHRLARKRVVTPRDLQDEPFVSLARGDRTRERVEKVLAEHAITPQRVIETPYGSTQCALAGAGVGLALVNPLVVRDMQAACAITVRPFEPAIAYRGWLAFSPGAGLGAMQQAFAAECRAEMDVFVDRGRSSRATA